MAILEKDLFKLINENGLVIASDCLDDLDVRVMQLAGTKGGVDGGTISITPVGDSVSVETYFTPNIALPALSDVESYLVGTHPAHFRG